MRNRVILYSSLALTLVLIFSTAGLVDGARKFLAERFGPGVYKTAYLPLVIFVILIARSIVKSGRAVWRRLILLALLMILLSVQMATLRFAIEKIHYVEFGLLAVLAAAAFSLDLGAGASLGLAVLFSYGAGLGDEALQSLHPERVADFADVVLNVKAGLFGAAVFGIWRFPSLRGFRPSPRERVLLLAALLLGLAAAFGFVERVHGYGFLIRDRAGIAFYTSLDREKLNRADLIYAVGDERDSPVQRTFADEASRHHFQREFYRENRFKYGEKSWYIDYGKAFRENLVLEKGYPAWLDAEGKRWTDSVRADMERRSRAFKEPEWTSRVKSRMIVSATAGRVRAGFAAGAGLLLIGLFGCLWTIFRNPILSCPAPKE